MSAYRLVSLGLAIVFAACGLTFLLRPDETLELFNAVSRNLGMNEAAAGDNRFFLILAAAYMYLVTALAWAMFRRPLERIYPLLLCQAKWASAALSLGLFFLQAPLLIYLCNGIVDGLLGLLAFVMGRRARA